MNAAFGWLWKKILKNADCGVFACDESLRTKMVVIFVIMDGI